ncbi:HSPB1-associated protein 1 isoform X2 [Rhineura floridana]|uniref:HSPB1-associated protein 1 isoform X2 n=1 Tax=Rhineura floridana TaxID=261503 RepID=UPI002AC83471|nr:HSPB1-associated protein 1 isoform X2 [Rhineura floridana]
MTQNVMPLSEIGRTERKMMATRAAAQIPSLPGDDVKPFTPEQVKEILMSLQKPAVFCNMAFDWPALHWNVTCLAKLLSGKRILFRIGRKDIDTAPLFETECSYAEATLEEFLAWSGGQPSCSCGPFIAYDLCKYWTYADYKYIAMLFEDKPENFQDMRWSDFGFPERNGRESTLWIGSAGANTPCHLDSYGCNLVLQVQGRKRWHLYPPEDSSFLYPTRIPYEESSVFSRVNVINPDLKSCPQFTKAKAHVVTLEPGQVLFVPRHWWHYVESIDPITVSINSWIELDADHEARIEEAITRTLICAIKSAESPSASDSWLNPTEVEVTSHETNLQYINGAVSAYLEHQKASKIEHKDHGSHGTNEISQGPCKRRKVQVNEEPEDFKSISCESNLTVVKTKKLETIPFGQNLFQILPQTWEVNSRGIAENNCKELLNENDGCFGKLHHAEKTPEIISDSGTLVDPGCSASSPQAVISTNDLLDCVLNPQVISLMAQLLLERASV